MYEYAIGILVGLGLYLALVHFLRFRRIKNLTRSLGFEGLSSEQMYEKMTLKDAEEIQLFLAEYEFPRVYELALQFALFRTYGFPLVSALLQGTRQFVHPDLAPKRYADTGVLITEFICNPLGSERASTAIARMNYLHSRHSKIRPQDTLYTLTLFATQGELFVRRYEWRNFTDMERVAMWKFWYELGLRMGIPKETIPKTFEGLVEYYEEFEKKEMIPAESNHVTALMTMELLIYYVPVFLKPIARKFVVAVMDDRLRIAMILDPPAPITVSILNAFMATRAFIIRHLHLPRISRVRNMREKPDPKTGRYYRDEFDMEPWYLPPTFWNRWGPWALIARIAGWPVVTPGRYGSNGYDIADVGPTTFEGKGREEVLKNAQEIRRRAGCPF